MYLAPKRARACAVAGDSPGPAIYENAVSVSICRSPSSIVDLTMVTLSNTRRTERPAKMDKRLGIIDSIQVDHRIGSADQPSIGQRVLGDLHFASEKQVVNQPMALHTRKQSGIMGNVYIS